MFREFVPPIVPASEEVFGERVYSTASLYFLSIAVVYHPPTFIFIV
jgi:hypothetical protein